MYAAWAEGQTDGGDAVAESNRGAEGDDGKVILQGVWIKAGVPHKGDRQYSVKLQKAFPKLFTLQPNISDSHIVLYFSDATQTVVEFNLAVCKIVKSFI